MQKDIFYEDYAQHLKGEYKDAYDQMFVYIESTLQTVSQQNAIMNELLDLLLSAQNDQRSLESLIGQDIQLFCDQFIQAYDDSLSNKFLSFMSCYRYIAIIAFVMQFMQMILDYFDQIPEPWNINIYMGSFFGCMFLSVLIFMFFQFIAKQLIFKVSWYTRKVHTILSVIIFAIIVIGSFYLPEEIDAYLFLPRWLFLIVMLGVYFISRDYKRKEKKQLREEGLDIPIDDIVYQENVKQYRKKYEKYCLKCQRKNEEALDVHEWYERKYQKDILGERIGKIIFILIVIVFIINVFLTSELFDAICFTVLLLLIEISIYRFMDKGRLMRIKLYQTIHEKHIDIYDDSLLSEE